MVVFQVLQIISFRDALMVVFVGVLERWKASTPTADASNTKYYIDSYSFSKYGAVPEISANDVSILATLLITVIELQYHWWKHSVLK